MLHLTYEDTKAQRRRGLLGASRGPEPGLIPVWEGSCTSTAPRGPMSLGRLRVCDPSCVPRVGGQLS